MKTMSTMSGMARSTIYLYISEGLWPKPVRLGLRASGWPADEIEVILRARACGKNQTEIRALVAYLEGQRLVAFRNRPATPS